MIVQPMIVQRIRTTTLDRCQVLLSNIEPGTPDAVVAIFARGAAAGYHQGRPAGPATVEWCDADGLTLDAGTDTSGATVARVSVELGES